MKKLIFITNSEGKVKEAQEILGTNFEVILHKLDLDEIQTIEGSQVIEKKAKEAFRILKAPVLVEDTSLYFMGWNRLPGALVRWFLDAVGCDGICQMMKGQKDRRAIAQSAVCYFDGKNLKVEFGEICGEVPESSRGEYKFGWDPIFIPEGHEQTFAEMGREEKK